MKTTELFVEQVLIGLAVIAVTALIVGGEVASFLLDPKPGELAVILAVAYLIGIIFDRYSDTLLGGLEQHHRLHFALKRFKGGVVPSEDPFPEDKYRIKILHNDRASDYAHYLRSRIRLTRAMTVLVPALMVAIPVTLGTAAGTARHVICFLVVAVYAAFFLVGVKRRKDATADNVTENPKGSYKPPRTTGLLDEVVREWYAKKWSAQDAQEDYPLAVFVLRNESISWAVLVLAIVGLASFVLFHQPEQKLPLLVAGLILVGGLAVTALVGWSWWRITETFCRFLADYDGFSSETRPAD
jgi:hypothetical protein